MNEHWRDLEAQYGYSGDDSLEGKIKNKETLEKRIADLEGKLENPVSEDDSRANSEIRMQLENLREQLEKANKTLVDSNPDDKSGMNSEDRLRQLEEEAGTREK